MSRSYAHLSDDELRAAWARLADTEKDASEVLQEWIDRDLGPPPGGRYTLAARVALTRFTEDLRKGER